MIMNVLASLLLAVTLAPEEATLPQTAAPKAATQAPATPAQPAARSDNYVIGPQDQLSITVFEEPSLTGKYRVENDGFFNFRFSSASVRRAAPSAASRSR
jgi:protein involved in polysaccharide export with SLBB domain